MSNKIEHKFKIGQTVYAVAGTQSYKPFVIKRVRITIEKGQKNIIIYDPESGGYEIEEDLFETKHQVKEHLMNKLKKELEDCYEQF